jgi:hypothetical protein
MNPGPGIMMPPINMDDRPIGHVLTIKPGNNGYAVFVEEDQKVKKTLSKADILNSVSDIASELQANMSGDEVAKIIRENDRKPDPDKEPDIELGMHVFKTLSEMQAFIAIVYDKDAIDLKRYQDKKNPAPKEKRHNSHMS